jgi:hypothetical protein
MARRVSALRMVRLRSDNGCRRILADQTITTRGGPWVIGAVSSFACADYSATYLVTPRRDRPYEIPQAANRVVGVLGLGRSAALRTVGAELLVRGSRGTSYCR